MNNRKNNVKDDFIPEDEMIKDDFSTQESMHSGISNFLRNITAGALQGAKSTGELLEMAIPKKGSMPFTINPKQYIGDYEQFSGKGYEQKKPDESSIFKNFDPYKLMGVEEQPITSLSGIEQALGEYGLPGYAVTKSIGKGLYKLTKKGTAKDILKTESKLLNKYDDLYEDLWKQAEKKGYGKELLVKPEIDISTLSRTTPKKKLLAVEKFIDNPTLSMAHTAKSDLLKLKRPLEKKTTLMEHEKDQLKAISDAIENIQNNMFKTEKGVIDKDLLSKYEEIQKGYANDVVPYTKNKDIQAYKRKEITLKQLLERLKLGEFAAKKGDIHKLETREAIRKSLGTLGKGVLFGTGFGTGVGGIYELGKYLLGK